MPSFKVLGNYSPNLNGLPGSCYLLKGFICPILLDLGNGNFHKVIEEIPLDQLDRLILILSHNHVDHSFDVLKFASYLKKNHKRISIFLPEKSLMYYTIRKYKSVFDVNIMNERLEFAIGEYQVSFCQTFHRGESYATKLENKEKSFVYTSDFSYVSRGLMSFCQNADSVLIDSGHPCKDEMISLKGYHGKTQETLQDLFSEKCDVKKVYASHLKANLKEADYLQVFPKEKSVQLVKMGKEYPIL